MPYFITLAAGQMATASPVSPEAALNRALKSERLLAPALTAGPVYIKGDDVKQVKVYSISGAMLKSSESCDNIDLSGYAPGMYLIEVEYGVGSTERIINRVIRR